jgi:hypothetical protein
MPVDPKPPKPPNGKGLVKKTQFQKFVLWLKSLIGLK